VVNDASCEEDAIISEGFVWKTMDNFGTKGKFHGQCPTSRHCKIFGLFMLIGIIQKLTLRSYFNTKKRNL
jgi:hypothetical protein